MTGTTMDGDPDGREDRRANRPRALTRVMLGLAVAAAIGALAAVTLIDQQASAAEGKVTLRLVVEFDRSAGARDDLPPRGDSPGDQVTYTEQVFASDNRTQVGRAMFLNTFQPEQGVLVNGALRLRDGTLTLAGALVNGAGTLAVTGGTGAYTGARGTYRRGEQIQVKGEDGPVRYRVTVTFTV